MIDLRIMKLKRFFIFYWQKTALKLTRNRKLRIPGPDQITVKCVIKFSGEFRRRT